MVSEPLAQFLEERLQFPVGNRIHGEYVRMRSGTAIDLARLGLRGAARRSLDRQNIINPAGVLLLLLTLVTGPRRSLSLKLSAARVYEP